MLRTAWVLLLGVSLVACFASATSAAEKAAEKGKEMKLEGKITCAKCDLGITDGCATVIKVKDVVYYFDKASDKKYHKKICKKAADGTVTGTVEEKDGKKFITVTKVEYKE